MSKVFPTKDEDLKLIDELEKQGSAEIKNYYCIKDKVAEDYCDFFAAQNHAAALRSFNHTIAIQLKSGIITNENDYELYFVGKAVVYKGFLNFYPQVQLVYDNEDNNKEN